MHNWNFASVCSERGRQNGVGVSLDNNGGWPPLLEDPVESRHRKTDLAPARLATDLQEDLGLRQAELLEERIG